MGDEMGDERITIREMCDLFGVTPRTLRFYETKELLSPDRAGQHRLYGRRDRARMTLILRGKRFGFSLESIRRLLELYNDQDGQTRQIRQALELARARLGEMEARSAEINAAIHDLRDQIGLGEDYLHQTAQRPAASVKEKENSHASL